MKKSEILKIVFIIFIMIYSYNISNASVESTHKKEAIKNTLDKVYKINTSKFDIIIWKLNTEKLFNLKNKIDKIKYNKNYSKYSVKIRLLIDYLNLLVLDELWDKYTQKLLLENKLNYSDLNNLKLDKIKSKNIYKIFDINRLYTYKKVRLNSINQINNKDRKSKIDLYLIEKYKQDILIINWYISSIENNITKKYFTDNWWKFITLDLSYSPKYSKFQKKKNLDYSNYKYGDDCDYKWHYYSKDYCNWLNNFYLYKKNNILYKIRFKEEFYINNKISNLSSFTKWLINKGFDSEVLVYNPRSKQYFITNWGYKIENFSSINYESNIKKYWKTISSYSDWYNWLPYMVNFLVEKWARLHKLNVYKYKEEKIDIYKWMGWIQKAYNFYIDKNKGNKWYSFSWKQTCVSNIRNEKEFDIYKWLYKNYNNLNIYYTWDSGCEYIIAFGNFWRVEEYLKFDFKKSFQEVIFVNKNFEFTKFWKKYKVIMSDYTSWNNINLLFQQKLWFDYTYGIWWYKNQVILIDWNKFHFSKSWYSFKEIN